MTDKTEATKAQVLNKAFFEISDKKMEEIDLSEFNGPKGMFAKSISMKVFQEISNKCTVLKQGVDPENAKPTDYEFSDDFVAYNIAASVCDSEGNLIFTSDQIPAIQEKSMVLFDAVSASVLKMNKKISEKEVEEKVKK